MEIRKIHRRAARAVWEAAHDVDGVAKGLGLRPETVRKWLREPEVQRLIRQYETEHRDQMRRLAIRYGPSAAARLIQDLSSGDAAESRRSAESIVKLACNLLRPGPASAGAPAGESGPATGPQAQDPGEPHETMDPEKASRILEILAEES